jgi:hypothetical protein
MNYHILNGDSLAGTFAGTGIAGEVVVFREGLIDGDLSGDTLEEFWRARARYMGLTDAEYYAGVVNDFERVLKAPGGSEINLWFEYDLFCQVNMWFILSLLRERSGEVRVCAVYSSHLNKGDNGFWNGFGPATTEELLGCLSRKITLSDSDLQLGYALWTAYKNADLAALTRLSRNSSPVFPHLQEVVEAHLDRFPKDGKGGRPERMLEEIMKKGSTEFTHVFQEFWKRGSIYGFGDIQLKRLYDKVLMDEKSR